MLSDEDSDAGYQEIKLIAGRDGLDKIMGEGNLDVIVANSDGELAMFAAFTGKEVSHSHSRVAYVASLGGI